MTGGLPRASLRWGQPETDKRMDEGSIEISMHCSRSWCRAEILLIHFPTLLPTPHLLQLVAISSSTRRKEYKYLLLIDEDMLIRIPTWHDHLTDQTPYPLFELCPRIRRFEQQSIFLWYFRSFPPSALDEELGNLITGDVGA